MADERLEALERVKWIDAERGVENNGSLDQYMSVLKIFTDSAQRACDDLDSFIDIGDRSNYVIKVHALKSMLRVIGTSGPGERAEALEYAGKSGDDSYISEHHAGFVKDVRELICGIKEAAESIADQEDGGIIESEDKPLIDPFVLEEAYAELYKAAREMDIDGLEELVKLVDDYSLPEDESETFERIRAACDEFEYEVIAELLEEKQNNKS